MRRTEQRMGIPRWMSEMTGHDRIKNDNIMDSLGVVLPTKKMKVPG